MTVEQRLYSALPYSVLLLYSTSALLYWALVPLASPREEITQIGWLVPAAGLDSSSNWEMPSRLERSWVIG